jgi:hypothetical protein
MSQEDKVLKSQTHQVDSKGFTKERPNTASLDRL